MVLHIALDNNKKWSYGYGVPFLWYTPDTLLVPNVAVSAYILCNYLRGFMTMIILITQGGGGDSTMGQKSIT